MHIFRFASTLLLGSGLAFAQSTSAPANKAAVPVEPRTLHSFDLSAIDKSADPCVDFYAYACGNWRKNNPIPGDQARWGRFNELNERDRYLLYVDLSRAANNPQTPLQQKYGAFFAACMNSDLADQLGEKPILPVLANIDALTDKQGLAPLVARLQADDATGAFFRFDTEQDQKDSTRQIGAAFQSGLTLPDRDYYLLDDARMTKIREQYKEYIISLFKLAGDNDDKAAAEAANVLAIETALAKGSLPRVDLRDPDKRYHLLPVSDLNTLAPSFDWSAYLSGIRAPAIHELNIGTPDFFKAMNEVIQSQSLDSLKSYLRFHALSGAAPWLSSPYVDLNYGFFQKTLQGQAEQTARWKRCTALTDRALGEAVGQDWVKENFPPQAKVNMEKLVAALEKSLDEDIQNLPWMTADTKKQAEAKLAAFRQKIGYPEKWRDYSALDVKPSDYFGDVQRAYRFEDARQWNKLGKPVDLNEWGMTPPTVNAYFNPQMNDINFPAGVLQPPLYDAKMDDAPNYGNTGSTIGHELTHGFDDEGRQFDAKGNLKDWWTKEDADQFVKHADCVVDQYAQYVVVDDIHINSKLTEGEDVADLGGSILAYIAWKDATKDMTLQDRDGLTPDQRFFVGLAQWACENERPENLRVNAVTDPHSPGKYRINGVVVNMPEFGKAFSCKVGQPMAKPPEKVCHVW